MNDISLYKCPRCHTTFCLKDGGKLNSYNLPGLLDCGHAICFQCVSKEQRSQNIICCSICKIDSPAVFRLNCFIFGCLNKYKDNIKCMRDKFLPSHPPLSEGNAQILKGDYPHSDQKCCAACRYPNVTLECCKCGFLCRRCSDQKHSYLSIDIDGSAHKITLVEDLNVNFITCERHNDKIDFFCGDCKIFLCAQCGFEFHSGHKNITKFQAYISNNTGVIEEAVSKSNRIAKVMKQSVDEVNKALKVKKEESDILASKIKTEFNYLIGLLQLEQEKMLKKLYEDTETILEENNAKQIRKNYSEVLKLANAGRTFLKDTSKASTLKEELKLLLKIDELGCYTEPVKAIVNNNNATFSLRNESFNDFLNSLSFEPISPIDFKFKSFSEISSEILSGSDFANGDQFSNKKTADFSNELLPNKTKATTEKNLSIQKSKSSKNSFLKKFIKVEPKEFYSVKVVHIVSPHEFYVIKESNLKSLESMMTCLSDFGVHGFDVKVDQGVEIDQLYLLNDERYGWVRCRVVNMNTSETIDELDYEKNPMSTCDCFLLDFGSTETIEISKLLEADEQCFSVPPFAIKCSLYQIMPFEKERNWSVEAIDQMKNFVMGKIAGMRVYDREGDTLIVDLGDFKNNIFDHYIPYSVRDCLIFLEYAHFDLPLDCRFAKETFPSLPLLPKNSEKIVHVVHCLSLSDFYIILDDYSQELLGMINEINNLSLETREPLSGPRIGMPCLAIHEDNWYRGEITNLKKGKMVVVNYVDFGNEETISYKNVRRMDKKYLSFPKMAINCCLACVKPVKNKWTKEAIDYFVDFVNEKSLTLRVESVLKNILQVSLHIAEMCLNSVLVDGGYGISSELLSLNQIDQQTLERISVNEPAIASQKCDDPCENLQLIIVVNAEDPSCIYVRFADLEEHYYSFMEDLKAKCDNESLESSVEKVWQENDKCAYCYKKSWSRVEIKELDEGEAHVINIDDGTTSTVKRNSLYILPEPFCDEPPFAKRCHLFGIIPAGGNNWSAIALSTLGGLVEMEKIYLLKLGEVTEGSTPVDLLIKKNTVAGPVEPIVTTYTSFIEVLIESGVALPKKECRKQHLEALKVFLPKEEESSIKTKSEYARKENKTVNYFEFNQNPSCYDLTNIFSENLDVQTKYSISNCKLELSKSNKQLDDLDEVLKTEVKHQFLRWKLSNLEFIKKQSLNVTVRAVMENGEIWFNIDSSAETLDGVNQDIKRWVECNYSDARFTAFSHHVRIGDDCIAVFDEEGWYRANVLDITGNVSDPIFKVLFIDYGSVREVSSSQIGPYDGPAIDIPQQALICNLHGVRPISENDWDLAALNWLCNMTEGKHFKLTVKVPSIGATLMQASLKGSGRESLKEEMINAHHAVENATVKKTRTNKKSKPTINSLKETVLEKPIKPNDMIKTDLPIGTELKLKIIRATDPNFFYAEFIPESCDEPEIQALIKNKLKCLESLTSVLSVQAPTWPLVSIIKKDIHYCAFSTVRNIWVRIKIEDVEDEDKIKAFLIDFGDIEIISFKNLRTVDEEFEKMISPQAMLFQLHQVYPDLENWNPFVIDFMNKVYKKNKFKVILKSEIHTSPAVQVDLYEDDFFPSKEISSKLVYQELIDCGFITLIRSSPS